MEGEQQCGKTRSWLISSEIGYIVVYHEHWKIGPPNTISAYLRMCICRKKDTWCRSQFSSYSDFKPTGSKLANFWFFIKSTLWCLLFHLTERNTESTFVNTLKRASDENDEMDPLCREVWLSPSKQSYAIHGCSIHMVQLQTPRRTRYHTRHKACVKE